MITGRADRLPQWPARPADRRRSGLRNSRQRGQATVELALVLPLIAVLLLLMVQAGLVVRDQLVITHAAREAARAAAVDPGADVAAIVGQRTDLDGVTAQQTQDGGNVRVDVHAEIVVRVPLLAMLRPTVGLDASATMRVETG